MFILPGLLGLVAYILVRPFDFVPALRPVPFLYLFFGLAVAGFLIDLARRKTRWIRAPHLLWTVAFVVWAVLTVLPRAPATLLTSGPKLLIPVALFVLIAHGITDFRRFSLLTGVVLFCTISVSAFCVYQGLQPFQCVGWDPDGGPDQLGVGDGRPCNDHTVCNESPPEPNWEYRCERIGLAGVTTLSLGRVRYVGVLHDPNEAALTVGVGVPIAIARYQRRRSPRRFVVMCLTIALAAATVVFSQSRSGQLVFLTVLGVYFLKRFRIKGAILALLLALPVLMYGGRGGEEAEASSSDRLGCAYAGIQMFIRSPLIGVGYDRFTEHHSQTAHDSFVLAPAELGVIGMVLWGTIYWISLKICLSALRDMTGPDAVEARTWGLGLFASLAGMCVGILFLSFNYHVVLWTFFGIAGAYYGIVARSNPRWRVRVGVKDVVSVAAANLGLLVVLLVYMRIRGVH
jgi:hypothetical protein